MGITRKYGTISLRRIIKIGLLVLNSVINNVQTLQADFKLNSDNKIVIIKTSLRER